MAMAQNPTQTVPKVIAGISLDVSVFLPGISCMNII